MLKRFPALNWLLLTLLLMVSIFVSLTLGHVDIPFSQIISVSAKTDPLIETVIWQVRLPRIITALCVGAGLAVCGALLQNASRNPLADPYLFGLMAGAGLGATLVSIVLPAAKYSVAAGAFAGALFAVLLVFLACIGQRRLKIEMTLLAGVAVTFMLSAISSFILYLAEPFAANRIMFWLMGSLSSAGWSSVMLISPVVLLVILLAITGRRQLDVLLLPDSSALSLGVNPTRLRLAIALITALVTACIVAQCGGIAFVGLMIPHIVRQLFGVTAIPLILGSVLLGAVFLLWVDNIARTLMAYQEIPLGVITSVIGSIFFLFMMRKKT